MKAMNPNPNANPSAAAKEPERASFESLRETPGTAGDVGLDVLLDVTVTLSMEVGRVRLPIRSLLQLSQGSVLELDRKVGEAIDIYVNSRLVARGEVVIVDERLGVTMTEIIKDGDAQA